MKSKGVTIQTKALNEFFLTVVFMLLLNRVHVFANLMFHLKRETWQCNACNLFSGSSPSN